MRTAAALLCAASLAALVLGGCATSSGPEPLEGPNFDDRTVPENVIHNIQLAYVDMNATEYLDCLSEDFEFYPTEEDVQNPDIQIPPVWYKTDEQNMHNNMFDDSSDVNSITLTLTTTSIVYDYGLPGDETDDTCICDVEVDLRVNLVVGLTYLATSPSRFYMRIDQDQLGPGGVYLWEICEWFDLGETGRGIADAAVEDATWGSVKAMYR